MSDVEGLDFDLFEGLDFGSGRRRSITSPPSEGKLSVFETRLTPEQDEINHGVACELQREIASYRTHPIFNNLKSEISREYYKIGCDTVYLIMDIDETKDLTLTADGRLYIPKHVPFDVCLGYEIDWKERFDRLSTKRECANDAEEILEELRMRWGALKAVLTRMGIQPVETVQDQGRPAEQDLQLWLEFEKMKIQEQ